MEYTLFFTVPQSKTRLFGPKALEFLEPRNNSSIIIVGLFNSSADPNPGSTSPGAKLQIMQVIQLPPGNVSYVDNTDHTDREYICVVERSRS